MWRHDDDPRHSGETVVQNASDARAEHGGGRVLRGHHGCSGGTWNAVDDGRRLERVSTGLYRLQRC